MIMINALGIFTICFLENFNEAKYIAFSTFAIGIVWLAFIPTYVATDGDKQLQDATIALTLMMMALCILLCTIVTRLYIAIRNKSTQTTSTSVTLGTNKVPTFTDRDSELTERMVVKKH